MYRLTKRYVDGSYTFNAPLVEITDRLAEYEEAEESGLLVRLPCRIGGTVYLTIEHEKKVQKAIVEMFHIDSMGLEVEAVYNHFGLVCFCGRIGTNVFTTPEEADASLRKRK